MGLPTASNLIFGGNLASNSYGAVLQSSGTFSRSLGSGAGQVQWTGDGGFAAIGGPLTVSLNNGGNPLVWNSTPGFLSEGNVLTLGSPTANNQVNFTNSIGLNGEIRQIYVAQGPAATDRLDLRQHRRQRRRGQPAEDRGGRLDPQRQQHLLGRYDRRQRHADDRQRLLATHRFELGGGGGRHVHL